MSNKEMLREYAELTVKIGAAVHEGQILFLRAPVECAEFARLCAEEAYKLGCKEVVTDWSDGTMTRLYYLNAADELFDEPRSWIVEKFNAILKEDFSVISIYAEDPAELAGVDPNRLERRSRAMNKALKEYYDKMMRNGFAWTVVSVPIMSWAKKVFPQLPDDEAQEALWAAIYKTVRINGDGKAVDRWDEALAKMAKRTEKLNSMKLKSLHYKNAAGTDFYTELPEGAIWLGGTDKTLSGVEFMANIPTEEIFTAPKADSGRGTIVASLPLCLNGNVIKGIRFEVENGKIVKATADEGEEVLKKELGLDEGASFFGELALVEYNSPISNMKMLFYNTLFDENASCHIAFGNSYPCIVNAEKYSEEELRERGFNYSMTHVDFMVGTPDLEITGVTWDGKNVQIFKDGNFAI